MSYAQVESYNMNLDTLQMISGENAIEVSKAAKETLISIEKKMKLYIDDNQISRINIYKVIKNIRESNDIFDFITESIKYIEFAKGYAVDKVLEIYRKANIKSAMINIGGNIGILGKRKDGSPWVVEIQELCNNKIQCIGALKVEDISVFTYRYDENKYEINDMVEYSDLNSVSVICKEGIKADILSKIIFTMGLPKGIKLLKSLKDVQGILISKEKEIYINLELKNSFYMFDQENYKCVYF